MTKEPYDFKYIPYERYLLKLLIDGKGPYYSKRIGRESAAHEESRRLDMLAGIRCEVLDTKGGGKDGR